MSTTYEGDETATQAPSPAPGQDVNPKGVIPSGGDARNIGSLEQIFRVVLDFIAWLMNHAEVRDYQPGMRFRENWLGYALKDSGGGGTQPSGMATSWRVVSSSAATLGGASSGLVWNDSASPSIRIYPGTGNGDNAWLISATVDGAGPAVLAYTGGLFSADSGAHPCKVRIQWAAALETVNPNTTTFVMGASDSSETDRAFKNYDATGNYFGFSKTSTQTSWRAVTAGGGARTTTDTGVTLADDEMHLFAMELDTTLGTPEIRFYIDGALVAAHDTDMPSKGMRLAFGGIRTAATAGNNYLNVCPVYTYATIPGI